MTTQNSWIIDCIRRAVYGMFAVIWGILFFHYWSLVRFYFNFPDWFNNMKIIQITWVLETWMLLCLIMLTWCVFKIFEK